ncbi:hypothetical protein ABR737_25250 [Streptomyces sp. Edi2]|jgi:hypothetical protein|uniref:hypothetical protein n=1 Tax=Streptomyces sp. Edi2 TaxID=3162528 RepID=UPI003305C288
MNEIAFAEQMIAEFDHALSGYEAINAWDLYEEQSRERAWWVDRLRSLKAA